MSQGWIKLHRQIQDHWLYPSGREFTEYEAWQDIILSVNHKEKKVRIKNRVLTCKRGQSLRSTKNWAKRWNWSKSKVYRFFNLLEKEDMIETESETVTTRLSVCNYCTYQDQRNANETQMKRGRNDPETEADTNKNDKNDKNVKNGNKSVGTNGTDEFPDVCKFLAESEQIAKYLLEAIIEYDPTHKYAHNRPAIRNWVLDIERAMRLDGRTQEQLEFIIDYIYRANGRHSDFWAGNVESGKKLRKHFDKIKTQIRSESNGRTNGRKQENIEREIQKFG